MILTCPNCATRFFANDEAIGPVGRRVECDACGTIWMSSKNVSPRPVWEIVPNAAKQETGGETAFENDASVAASTPLFVERGVVARKKATKRSGIGLTVGLFVVILVVAAAAFLIFQRPIEQAFPGATAVYQALGLSHSGMGVG